MRAHLLSAALELPTIRLLTRGLPIADTGAGAAAAAAAAAASSSARALRSNDWVGLM
jgi:hypothetical protein